jgi:hypothetical protein
MQCAVTYDRSAVDDESFHSVEQVARQAACMRRTVSLSAGSVDDMCHLASFLYTVSDCIDCDWCPLAGRTCQSLSPKVPADFGQL